MIPHVYALKEMRRRKHQTVTHAGYVKEYTYRLLYMRDGKFSNAIPEVEFEGSFLEVFRKL